MKVAVLQLGYKGFQVLSCDLLTGRGTVPTAEKSWKTKEDSSVLDNNDEKFLQNRFNFEVGKRRTFVFWGF